MHFTKKSTYGKTILKKVIELLTKQNYKKGILSKKHHTQHYFFVKKAHLVYIIVSTDVVANGFNEVIARFCRYLHV